MIEGEYVSQYTNVSLALIVLAGSILTAIIGVFSAWLLAQQSASTRRAERQEDYARQDLVAARVTEAADKAARVAATLLVSNEKVAKTAEATIEKIDSLDKQTKVIHTLVNSTLSSAKISERNAFVLLFAFMKNPSMITQEKIKEVEQRITDLNAIVSERAEQTRLAELQAKEVDHEPAKLA